MRLKASAFMQRASSKGGAIVEGDGEVLVPPVLQIGAEVGAPLFNLIGGASLNLTNQSVAVWAADSRIDAGPVSERNLCVLGSGIWIINWTWFSHFTGTDAYGNGMGLFMVDTDADTRQYFCFHQFINGQGLQLSDRYVIDIGFRSAELRILHSATLAGDKLAFFAQVIAQRVLP